MESLNLQGLIQTSGVLLWVSLIAVISLELVRALRKEEFGRSNKHWVVSFNLITLITTILTGSTGLFFLYEWELWNSLIEVDFWWAHSMILVWILFNIVLFIVDPLLLSRPE